MKRLTDMTHSELSYAVLRFAVGGTFLWFGLDKWFHPEAWEGWVPGWAWAFLPLSEALFMKVMAVLEVAVGVAMVSARRVREAAAIATVVMAGISLSIGLNAIAVRDTSLLGACLAMLVIADGRSKRQIGPKRLGMLVALFVLVFFVVGVGYLRNA